jgi:hypothetical protein
MQQPPIPESLLEDAQVLPIQVLNIRKHLCPSLYIEDMQRIGLSYLNCGPVRSEKYCYADTEMRRACENQALQEIEDKVHTYALSLDVLGVKYKFKRSSLQCLEHTVGSKHTFQYEIELFAEFDSPVYFPAQVTAPALSISAVVKEQ